MKKIIKKEVIFLIVFLLSLYYVNSVDCGGETGNPCSCGNTVIGSYLLQNDLNCNTDYALIIKSNANDEVILDCNSHKITNLETNNNNIGILLIKDWQYLFGGDEQKNIIVKNCVIDNFKHGIATADPNGIYYNDNQYGCYGCLITKNSFINNKIGISVSGQPYPNNAVPPLNIYKNSFVNNGIDNPTEGAAIHIGNDPEIYGSGHGETVNITYNCITNNDGYGGIYIDYYKSYLSRVKISYNVLNDNALSFKAPEHGEIGMCFSNNNEYCNANQKVNISYNYYDLSGNFPISGGDPNLCLETGEIYITGTLSNPYRSYITGAECCGGVLGNAMCEYNYINSNPIPGWEICNDDIDNDCDNAIDNLDSDCPAYCGNNIIGGNEQCDGTNLNNKDCTNYIPNSPYTGGTLSCNLPGSPNQCQFNTQNCYSCGVEGNPSNCALPGNINQQDGCCGPGVSPLYPAGLKCRYYEFESYQYPYAKKCCENDLETTRQCGTVSSNYVCNNNPSPIDVACCNGLEPPSENDCVYNNKCYTDDNNPNSKVDIITVNNIELHCSLKHWCPLGFVWSNSEQLCIQAEAPCYVGPLNNFCTNYVYPYIQDPYNCLYGGPQSNPSIGNPGPLPYEQSCCFDMSLFSLNYYEWTGISVYDTSGNLVSSGGGAT